MSGGEEEAMDDVPQGPLRRGWTTGACATAATRAAYEALVTGHFPDPVEIDLPAGSRVAFALATSERSADCAIAGIVKDAGDDPDVTHGVLIKATVRAGAAGSDVTFRAGEGVGTVTKPGLPIPPGEPAINPVPRNMMRKAIRDVVELFGASGDVVVEISVPGGEAIAARTWNGRLGIVGGLSILGTTGIVVPYSCSAWIHSIHRGIDVARATGLEHVAGSTGSTSEKAVQALHQLPESALIDMGDFVGGMLKYLRRNPIKKVTIAGGFAKMTKLGQGLLDLHSKAGQVDRVWLANLLKEAGAPSDLVESCHNANSALQVLQEADKRGVPIGQLVARAALNTATEVLGGSDIELDTAVFDRQGRLVGAAHDLPRKRR
jgi:cobalt-precorrin-5B (C1)-methyltransferase